jgi:hypothetical protein
MWISSLKTPHCAVKSIFARENVVELTQESVQSRADAFAANRKLATVRFKLTTATSTIQDFQNAESELICELTSRVFLTSVNVSEIKSE